MAPVVAIASLVRMGFFAASYLVNESNATVATDISKSSGAGCIGCGDKATLRAFDHRDGKTAPAEPKSGAAGQVKSEER